MLLVDRHVTVYKKRRVWKVRGKALVGLRGLGAVAHYRRKRGVNLALGVGLRCRLAGVLQSVGPGEMAIQVIEATVLQVDDHNVLDPLRPRVCGPAAHAHWFTAASKVRPSIEPMRCHRFRIFDFIWGPSREYSSGAGAGQPQRADR